MLSRGDRRVAVSSCWQSCISRCASDARSGRGGWSRLWAPRDRCVRDRQRQTPATLLAVCSFARLAHTIATRTRGGLAIVRRILSILCGRLAGRVRHDPSEAPEYYSLVESDGKDSDMSCALRYSEVAALGPMHVALVPMPSGRPRVEEHGHADFCEIVFGLDGSGWQQLGATALPVRRGSLTFVRPQDRHSFAVADGGHLRFMNLAFPVGMWEGFANLTGLDCVSHSQQSAPPLHVQVPDGDVPGLEIEFHRALRSYAVGPTALDLARVLVACLTTLAECPGARLTGEHPPQWLIDLCRAMSIEDNLRGGIRRLHELAPVSRGHLARVMKRYLGRSPVQFITERRLVHAANLLVATSDSVTTVSVRCGFGSPSYFGELFRVRYGKTPRDYRGGAWRSVPG